MSFCWKCFSRDWNCVDRLKKKKRKKDYGVFIIMSFGRRMWIWNYWVATKFLPFVGGFSNALRWRHDDHDGVSNHQPHGCLLNRLFKRRPKKTSKLHVTGLCAGNSPGRVNSPHKGPVTRKIFPFDDVIMAFPYMKIALFDSDFIEVCSSGPIIKTAALV